MHYKKLCNLYELIQSTTKRLEKTKHIADFLKQVPTSELPKILLLIQGKLYPRYDPREVGVASRIAIKALETATGQTLKEIERDWKNTGDLGITAQNLTQSKKQATLFSQDLSIKKVFTNLQKIGEEQGTGSVDRKIQLIAELLSSAQPLEAKYLLRTILGQMRVGIGDGTLRDAITWAFFWDKLTAEYNEEKKTIDVEDREIYNEYTTIVQTAYDLTNDLGPVAQIAKTKGLIGLKKIGLTIGTPINVMLAQKAVTLEDAFKAVGTPAQIEYKYDGFRVQVHKNKNIITLFTRRLENVTTQFPDIVEAVKQHVKAETCILDGEAVGFDPKTKNYLPFQNVSQRIRRKHDIERIKEKLPVEYNVFDILELNGKNLIAQPFQERLKLLTKIITPKQFELTNAQHIITQSQDEARAFFQKAINDKHEGIIFKSLDAPYKPGSRVGFMVKYKEAKDGLDVVIVKAQWGEGKRSSWITSYTIACVDENGDFQEIGKVSTGLKEKEEEGLSFNQLTQLIKPLIITEENKHLHVKPEIILEVAYEEIQQSKTYSSGFALRFPRILRLRSDRDPYDIATLQDLELLFQNQKK